MANIQSLWARNIKNKPVIAFFDVPLLSFEPPILLTKVSVLFIKRYFLNIPLLYLKHHILNPSFCISRPSAINHHHPAKVKDINLYLKVSKTEKKKQKTLGKLTGAWRLSDILNNTYTCARKQIHTE